MAVNNFQFSKESKVGDWRCVVHQEPWNDNAKVYLMFDGNGKRKIAKLENGAVILKDFVEGAESKPFMVIPYLAWQSIISVMGAIIPDEAIVETGSELKATKYHLEDLRTLLKIKSLTPLTNEGEGKE